MSDALEVFEPFVVRRTWRVPRPVGEPGDGAVVARQFDAALMSAGFKCSRELLEHLSGLNTGTVMDTAVRVLGVVREQAGDHVRHNAYFKDFPFNVPDTLDFWWQCLAGALADPVTAGQVETAAGSHPFSGRDLTGGINLRSLSAYGRYQHTFEEMLAAHGELIPSAGDRVTVLHLGGTLAEETLGLYHALAGSTIPVSEADRDVLWLLATDFVDGPQPEAIPVRENRALINSARLAKRAPLLVDTVTDVLRLAAALSGGDVGLRAPVRFRPFRRPERRVLLAALDSVVAVAPAKLGDVPVFAERWKRLGERLHPHEHPQWPHAQDVFAVARGEKEARSFTGQVEMLLAGGDVAGAAKLLSNAPGLLLRSVDRLLRLAAADKAARSAVVHAAHSAAGGASGRVLLSLREHFQNRGTRPGVARVFVNRNGRARAVPDTRPVLDADVLADLLGVIDAEVASRLPAPTHLVVDPAVLTVAVPLSAKTLPEGLGVLPRGSLMDVDAEILRFFVYWRQAQRRTDYDLSALMLDQGYGTPTHVSWTNLRNGYATHSGDITDPPPGGATEFIDIRLGQAPRRFLIPQVLVYSGEGFDEVEETFFGFMTRTTTQLGAPFEPRTVRAKSNLTGTGRIALPVVFARGDDGKWRAKWLHLYINGHQAFNQVEGAHLSTSLLVRSIVERDFLKVAYLADLLRVKASTVTVWQPGDDVPVTDGPVTFLGLERPEWLPEGSHAVTASNLADLVPA